MTLTPLYHFTCRDGFRRIGRYNCLLIPQTPIWPYVWLTTEAVPDFEATGLGSVTLKCDRREYRYIVRDTFGCWPWLGSQERRQLLPAWLEVLESYGDPEHWWISQGPLPAEWDRAWNLRHALTGKLT